MDFGYQKVIELMLYRNLRLQIIELVELGSVCFRFFLDKI
jgi:hypothetical protein